MCYLRKSSLKHILTLFIHWNFNFIGKMILECWLIGWLIPHRITPFSESEFPAIAACFFLSFLFIFLRNNPFGYITFLFVSPGHCTCLWLHQSHSRLGLFVYTESMGDPAAAWGSRQYKQSCWHFKSKLCFPKVMSICILIVKKICVTLFCLL